MMDFGLKSLNSCKSWIPRNMKTQFPVEGILLKTK